MYGFNRCVCAVRRLLSRCVVFYLHTRRSYQILHSWSRLIKHRSVSSVCCVPPQYCSPIGAHELNTLGNACAMLMPNSKLMWLSTCAAIWWSRGQPLNVELCVRTPCRAHAHTYPQSDRNNRTVRPVQAKRWFPWRRESCTSSIISEAHKHTHICIITRYIFMLYKQQIPTCLWLYLRERRTWDTGIRFC